MAETPNFTGTDAGARSSGIQHAIRANLQMLHCDQDRAVTETKKREPDRPRSLLDANRFQQVSNIALVLLPLCMGAKVLRPDEDYVLGVQTLSFTPGSVAFRRAPVL